MAESIRAKAKRRQTGSMVAEAFAMFDERRVRGSGPVAAQHDYKYGDDTTTGRDIRALYHSMVVEQQRAKPRNPIRSPTTSPLMPPKLRFGIDMTSDSQIALLSIAMPGRCKSSVSSLPTPHHTLNRCR